VVEALLSDPARLAPMAAASAKTGIADAAERLAELVAQAQGVKL
jgi:UDP-N-acetylglucosamine:LPS N-acetylglucosamine transferase